MTPLRSGSRCDITAQMLSIFAAPLKRRERALIPTYCKSLVADNCNMLDCIGSCHLVASGTARNGARMLHASLTETQCSCCLASAFAQLQLESVTCSGGGDLHASAAENPRAAGGARSEAGAPAGPHGADGGRRAGLRIHGAPHRGPGEEPQVVAGLTGHWSVGGAD